MSDFSTGQSAPPDQLALLDHRAVMSRAAEAHRRARAQVVTPRDNFLVYPDERAISESHTNGVREFSRRESEDIQDFLRNHTVPERLPYEGSDAAHIKRVLGAQRPDHVTEFTRKGKNSADYLPGGAPLVDHLHARLAFMPDWKVISPAINYLRQHRLPDLERPASQREIVLGETSERHVQVTLEFLREHVKLTKKTFFTCTLAADTESVGIEVADYRKLTSSQPGTNHTVRLASSGTPAESLPVVLTVGHVGWHVAIRIPTRVVKTSRGNPCLRIVPGTLQDGVPAFLTELGVMTGVGLVDDLRDFFKLVDHLYGVDLLGHVHAPLELDRLARLAGYNLVGYGVEALNWSCFGTILPKGRCSRGDGKWHLPWDALSTPLRAYMTADISQCAAAAELFKYLWAMHMFPDLHAVSQVSTLSAADLLLWWEKHITLRVDSYTQIPPWRAARSMGEVWPLLLGSSENGLAIADLQPCWPSLVAGGPRFLHSARAFLIEKLEILRGMSPLTWPVLPRTVLSQVLFNRHEVRGKPIPTDPTTSLQWSPDPMIRGKILHRQQAINWKAIRCLSEGGVGVKAVVLEFIRLNHSSGKDLLMRLESHRRAGSTVFGCVQKAARLVPSIREMLTALNSTPPRPKGWADPYKEEEAREGRLARLIARADEMASTARCKAEVSLRLCCQLKEAVRSVRKRPLNQINMAHPLLQLISPPGPHVAASALREPTATSEGPSVSKRRRRGPRRSRSERRARACEPMAMLRESLQNSRHQEAVTSQQGSDDEVLITRVVVNDLRRLANVDSACVNATAGMETADGRQVGPLRLPCLDAPRIASSQRPSVAALLSAERSGSSNWMARGSRSRRNIEMPADVQVLADTMEDSGRAVITVEEELAASRGPWDDERHRHAPQAPPLSPSVWATMRANALPHMVPRPLGGRPG